MTNNFIIIQSSFPTTYDEFPLCQKLISNKLAACIQKTAQITSYYTWNKAIQKDNEYLLLIKTLNKHFNNVQKIIIEHHPYDTAEILSINIGNINQNYLNWANSNLNT